MFGIGSRPYLWPWPKKANNLTNALQIVAKRLAISGLNVAYGLSDYPANGPFFTKVLVKPRHDGNRTIAITYNQRFRFDASETHGFYCCRQQNILECDAQCGGWTVV